MKLSAVGIPWYYKETYRAARALFVDGAKLPASYDDWLRGALEAESQVNARGQVAVRAYIDPKAFRLWCEERGVPADWSARSAFSHQTAHDEYTRRIGRRPVRVIFPDGYAEMGIEITATVVELSPAAVGLQLRDRLQIDGRSVSIVAKTVRFAPDERAEGTAEGSVTITFEEPKG